MSVVPPPPSPLTCFEHQIKAGTELVRMHDAGRAGTAFNPGFGKTRFAPISDLLGASIPTAYAGTTFDCVTFEYVFHNIDPAAAFKTVAFSSLDSIAVSVLRPARDLKLAAFFEIDLNKLGMTRAQLIDTPSDTYDDTATWSAAVHNLPDDFDGLVWTSRKCDPDLAMIFFGDRVISSDLDVVSTVRLTHNPDYLARVRDLGKRAGIEIVF